MNEHFYKPLPAAIGESGDRKRKTIVFLVSLMVFSFAVIFVVGDVFAGQALDSKENKTSAACEDRILVETCRDQLKLKKEELRELEQKINETNVENRAEIERIQKSVVELMGNVNELQKKLELCQQENRHLQDNRDIEKLRAQMNMVQEMVDGVLKELKSGKGRGNNINISIDLSSGNVYSHQYRNSVVILSPLRQLLFLAAFFRLL